MKKLVMVIIPLFTCYCLAAQQPSSKRLTYKIVPAANKTWGYDIYHNGKLFIHQPSVPALPGNAGFVTKEAAEKVAKKVILKINNGENPPSISIDEMKQLGVIK